MGLFSRHTPAQPADYEQRYRELRQTMQNIVIAHAATCYKHMRPEQYELVREEWARIVKGKGWASFFVDDSVPLPAAAWSPPAKTGEDAAVGALDLR